MGLGPPPFPLQTRPVNGADTGPSAYSWGCWWNNPFSTASADKWQHQAGSQVHLSSIPTVVLGCWQHHPTILFFFFSPIPTENLNPHSISQQSPNQRTGIVSNQKQTKQSWKQKRVGSKVWKPGEPINNHLGWRKWPSLGQTTSSVYCKCLGGFIPAGHCSIARKQRFQLSHLKILGIVCTVCFTELHIA